MFLNLCHNHAHLPRPVPQDEENVPCLFNTQVSCDNFPGYKLMVCFNVRNSLSMLAAWEWDEILVASPSQLNFTSQAEVQSCNNYIGPTLKACRNLATERKLQRDRKPL
ncbi:ABC transporter like protein [Corchorus olitorius]|uniref:ABC transporter like protein n=1 Tax=Corchorus olitorius TaxID=93759 RepID=A0A1R3KTI9_9ROSI|nr:ABC transporter like protein [Corchorus olitorius]